MLVFHEITDAFCFCFKSRYLPVQFSLACRDNGSTWLELPGKPWHKDSLEFQQKLEPWRVCLRSSRIPTKIYFLASPACSFVAGEIPFKG